MDQFELAFVNFSNAEEIERLYQNYLKDPKSVDPSFHDFFKGLLFQGHKSGGDSDITRIEKLIQGYRRFGHLKANLNPIASNRRDPIDHLALKNFGFTNEDLEREFPTCGLMKKKAAKLQEIEAILIQIYSGSIGVECDIPAQPELQSFVFETIEKKWVHPLSPEEKKQILKSLNRAEAFEAFIQLRYPGQKRFSIEGGESFIPLMQEMIQHLQQFSVEELVIGMAHRGRLNVLANILHKPYEEIFSEFEPKSKQFQEGLSGDVKYHKGYKSQEGSLKLTLCPNPSHLEAVNPVVLGRARAKQLEIGDLARVVPLIIHGDAAVSGQGIVYETMQMDGLDGFQNGGVIHLVINNQIGFTAKSEEGRSTLYCTDIAKAFNLPVFHVNGEDVEMCAKVARLACEIRQKFKTSVFIDYNCYRKYGHNETDEPRFTSPKMYEDISKKDSIFKIYSSKLIQENILSNEEKKQLEEEFKAILQTAHKNVENVVLKEETIHKNEPFPPVISTQCDIKILEQIINKISSIPEGFTVHPKLKKMIQERLENFQKSFENPTLDFAICEQMAYASLLLQKTPIRIVGEDSRRGTFSHRHAVLIDQVNENLYYQLNHLQDSQAMITVYNSFLSEYAAMGYEYGFSVEQPQTLVIWEAQFGDFANCAQVIIDQFLVSSYQKWTEESSLVLLLPHGYEGMGPEHSSARIERFMQLAAQNNIELIYPTLASQMFHLLRHQALKKHKTPMIVFSPKALLRQKETFAKLSDLTESGFMDFVDDLNVDPDNVEQLIFTIGKLVYELIPLKETHLKKSALIRIEKLYPMNEMQLKAIIKRYPKSKKIVLAQEEPINMGAIRILKDSFEKLVQTQEIILIARKESASTAAGSSLLHQFEQELLIKAIIEA